MVATLLIPSGPAAAAQRLTATPTTVSFGIVDEDDDELVREVRLVNEGDETLYVLSHSESGDVFHFWVTDNCPFELRPQEDCLMRIRYSPESEGTHTLRVRARMSSAEVTVLAGGQAVD